MSKDELFQDADPKISDGSLHDTAYSRGRATEDVKTGWNNDGLAGHYPHAKGCEDQAGAAIEIWAQ
jgi:hypothetical protein